MDKSSLYYNYYHQYFPKYRRYSEQSYLCDLHNKTIQQEAKLIDKLLPQKSNLMIMAVYYYLLWNGYFSASRTFCANSYPDELAVDRSISIACGNGCCRNVSTHFYKILQLLDRSSSFSLIGSRYGYVRQPLEENAAIRRRINPNMFSHYNVSEDSCNHLEVLYAPTMTLLDPFNFYIQKIKNNHSNKDDSKSVLLDVAVSAMFDFDLSETIRSNVFEKNSDGLDFFSECEVVPFPLQELRILQAKGIEICRNARNLLEQYTDKMQDDYQNIKKLTFGYKRCGY